MIFASEAKRFCLRLQPRVRAGNLIIEKFQNIFRVIFISAIYLLNWYRSFLLFIRNIQSVSVHLWFQGENSIENSAYKWQMHEINPCDPFAKCESFSQRPENLLQNAKAQRSDRRAFCKLRKP